MQQAPLIELPQLRLMIPGVPVSGNAKTRYVAIPRKDKTTGQHVLDSKGNKVYRAASFSTEEANEFEARVRSIAQYACLRQRWPLAEYCKVDILIFNVRQDRGNVAKTVEDALQGIVYVNDGRTLDGRLAKFKDRAGFAHPDSIYPNEAGKPRVEITVTLLDPRQYGY
jgi:Endodeoxyribonuclease RusA